MSSSAMPPREDLVEAIVASGSDYPAAYRLGAVVEIRLDGPTGQLIVTRGAGALKLALVTEPRLEALAARVQKRSCRGRIVDVEHRSQDRLIYIRLEGDCSQAICEADATG